MNFKRHLYKTTLLLTIVFSSCEKLLKVDLPLNERPSEVVFLSESAAKGALSGAYSQLSGNSSIVFDVTMINALAADELVFTANAQLGDIMTNTYDPITTTRFNAIWIDFYASIYRFNSIVLGLTGNTNISETVSKQMIGEAKALRAYCYYNLVNMFGEVPLVLATDPNITAFQARTPVADVYAQIIKDLEEAKQLIAENYVVNNGVSSRSQFNRFAAQALLAKVYLHVGNYPLALQNSSEVIAKKELYDLLPQADLTKVFLKDSKEAILQLGPPVNPINGYTIEGQSFLPTTRSTSTNYELSASLLAAFDKNNDRRFKGWVIESNLSNKKNYQPYKFQNVNQDSSVSKKRVEVPMVLRLAEQYLVRAEAKWRANDLVGALEDINILRRRAGLNEHQIDVDFEEAILLERQLEMFCELGNRWYTIKRLGKADEIMNALRPATWQSTAQLYPIPQTVRNSNPALSQNLGYR